MRRVLILTVIAIFAMGITMAGGKYHLNIIGKAQCDQADGDCWNGNGDVSNGHRIFVPLTTIHKAICDDASDLGVDVGGEIYESTMLQKGVRILVADGEDMGVVDADCTDGKCGFTIPNGCYKVEARAVGKPNGCMEIDTLTCEDEVCVDDVCEYVQVNCDADLGNDKWVLQGFLEVQRTKGSKPQWKNATDDLLGVSGALVKDDNYFSFLWEVYNNNLRILQLRIEEEECGF